jgi:hypothetical protein
MKLTTRNRQRKWLPSCALTLPLVALAALCLLSGCDSDALTGHDELSFEQRPYLGDELRMDGYYYSPYTTSEGTRHDVYFFYRNGVARYNGSPLDLDNVGNNASFYGDARHHWGLFHVDGDRIAFERWYPSSGTHTRAFIRSGRILNDTTFVITESRRSNGEDPRQQEEAYHFRAFSPKPDSTSGYLD